MKLTPGSFAFAITLCFVPLTGSAADKATNSEPTNAKESGAQNQAKPAYNLDADVRRKSAMSPDELAWEKILEENLGSFYLPRYKDDKAKSLETAWDYVKDVPGLPRVLIIGDSVSRAYTLPVRHALVNKANIHRAPENCGPTATGVKKLDLWLNGGKWDLITFNFSIHDRATPLAAYEKRLGEITQRLKATGAKLMWVSGTPLPKPEDDEKQMIPRNEAAAKIMHTNNIQIIDLYTFIKPQLEKYQRTNDVHFIDEGYELLGKKVAEDISHQLEAK